MALFPFDIFLVSTLPLSSNLSTSYPLD